jgi:hypothetical protein
MDYLQILAKQKEEALELVNKNREIVKQLLEKHKIARVEVEFDGIGDSGQVDSISFIDADGEDTDLNAEPCKLFTKTSKIVDGEYVNEILEQDSDAEGLIEEIVYYVLEAKHPGWEINEGSYGLVIINPDGSGQLEYNERVQSVETYNDEF